MQKSLYRLSRLIYTLRHWLTRRFTPAGLVLLGCLIFSGFVGGNTNQSMAYQIFTFLASILGIAIASSLFFRARFGATRILPRFGSVGVPLKYRIIVHNKNQRVQRHLKLLENFPQKQRVIAKTVDLPPLPPNHKTEVIAELIPYRRGVIRLTGITIACPDPFGLFQARVAIALPQSLLILPKLYHLPPVSLPGLRRYQSGGVALASSVGDSEEFMSLRDYRPGDPLRKIHWKSWAKVGKPLVREEQDEFFVRHALILDTFQQTQYSQILEEAVAVAASFACEVQTQESLLDLMFVGPEAYCFTFGRGLSHTDKMLEILASVVACQDKSFDSLIPVVLNRLALLSGCICIFLTWDDHRKKLVNHLQSMNIPTLVFIITDNASIPADLDTGLMSDDPENFRVLRVDNIQAGLMQL